MKKLILIYVILLGFDTYAQNTLPTTTITGALKINDSLRVNKMIMAKGEVVVKDTLRAKKDILVDGNATIDGNIIGNHNLKIKNNIIAKGEITAKDTLHAEKDAIINGNGKIGGKLSVSGNINTGNAIIIKNYHTIGLYPPIGNPTTDPVTTPSAGSNPIQLHFGPISTIPVAAAACTDGDYQPWVPLTNNFGGQIQLYDNTGPNMSYNPGGSILSMASWNSKSSIDVSGGTQSGLLMNYFCGKNIDMCNGPNGGIVSIGKKLCAEQSVRIGNDGSNSIDMNTSLTVHQNTGNAKAINVKTWNNSVKAFAVERTDGKNTFVVSGEGRTQIGIGQPKVGGVAANAMLSVDGLVLAKEIRVAIANTHWADYVFEKEYDLMPIKEVENYIAKNKHLPEVPSTIEVENNGVDVVEINATMLKKIEELTLYLIEQNNRIGKLEKENTILLSKLK